MRTLDYSYTTRHSTLVISVILSFYLLSGNHAQGQDGTRVYWLARKMRESPSGLKKGVEYAPGND